MFAFDGFYVYSAELFPTVIRYSMAGLNFFIKKKFARFVTRRSNGVMHGLIIFFFVKDLCQQNLHFFVFILPVVFTLQSETIWCLAYARPHMRTSRVITDICKGS